VLLRSAALGGKKVLVVHPFKESIENQYANRTLIFPGTSILPEFASLTCIQAVQSIAGENTEYETWFDALKYMQKQILDVDFDVAYGSSACNSVNFANLHERCTTFDSAPTPQRDTISALE